MSPTAGQGQRLLARLLRFRRAAREAATSHAVAGQRDPVTLRAEQRAWVLGKQLAEMFAQVFSIPEDGE